MRYVALTFVVVFFALNTCPADAAEPRVPDRSIRECLTRMPNARRTALCLVIRLGTKMALEVGKALGIEEAVLWAINELKRLGVIEDDENRYQQ